MQGQADRVHAAVSAIGHIAGQLIRVNRPNGCGLVNLNVHFHLVVPDSVFVDDDDRLAFALHPVPTSADVLAILDRIARRLADEGRDDSLEEGVDVLAQVQAEAAATWRSPQNGKPTVRGVERLRAWCEGSRCTLAL